MKYGKFPSFDDFLSSYLQAEQKERSLEISSKPREEQPAFIENAKNNDVVEVDSVSIEHQPDEKGSAGDIHYQVVINLTKIIVGNATVNDDLNRCLNDKASVFVAVRFGDNEGISEPITTGLDPGAALHIKGVWIPEDKAYTHGGEKMSVLHFTHHPLGFICTAEKCYQ